MQSEGPGGHQGGAGGHHLLPPAYAGEHHPAEDNQVIIKENYEEGETGFSAKLKQIKLVIAKYCACIIQ